MAAPMPNPPKTLAASVRAARGKPGIECRRESHAPRRRTPRRCRPQEWRSRHGASAVVRRRREGMSLVISCTPFLHPRKRSPTRRISLRTLRSNAVLRSCQPYSTDPATPPLITHTPLSGASPAGPSTAGSLSLDLLAPTSMLTSTPARLSRDSRDPAVQHIQHAHIRGGESASATSRARMRNRTRSRPAHRHSRQETPQEMPAS